ncbi:hypothetical protein EI74_0607 [Mycoplasma testudineum]|uniref:Uncharacterized protein n=1 Tax=Mycoplasma testudineum TaxID=244584 RepID=A0A4R6IC39_9MOLU|nr:hypothetical protein [Mycoplasma testudineum]OYD26673.1 hypothetical protein CG473_02635 [Mycoplasma testudineum]TDO19803.1 hypothetical protein EI74_0607 [Mycoplasma testudineum]
MILQILTPIEIGNKKMLEDNKINSKALIVGSEEDKYYFITLSENKTYESDLEITVGECKLYVDILHNYLITINDFHRAIIVKNHKADDIIDDENKLLIMSSLQKSLETNIDNHKLIKLIPKKHSQITSPTTI